MERTKVPAKLYRIYGERCNLQIIQYDNHIDIRSDFLGEFETVSEVTTPGHNINYNNNQMKWALYSELIKHLSAEDIIYELEK
jgi:hypothetical protein